MAKPASFCASQGQSEETRHRVGPTSALPGCQAQSISTEHHHVLLWATSTISCSAHPLLAATNPQPSIPSVANRGDGSSTLAQPHTAHTQLQGQLCAWPQGQVTAKTRGISALSTVRFEPSAR